MVLLFMGTLLTAQIWASVADAQGLPFPVNGVLGPIAAICGLAMTANWTCACAMWWNARSNHFEDAYNAASCRRAWCPCITRHCCRRGRRGVGEEVPIAPVIVVVNPFAS